MKLKISKFLLAISVNLFLFQTITYAEKVPPSNCEPSGLFSLNLQNSDLKDWEVFSHINIDLQDCSKLLVLSNKVGEIAAMKSSGGLVDLSYGDPGRFSKAWNLLADYQKYFLKSLRFENKVLLIGEARHLYSEERGIFMISILDDGNLEYSAYKNATAYKEISYWLPYENIEISSTILGKESITIKSHLMWKQIPLQKYIAQFSLKVPRDPVLVKENEFCDKINYSSPSWKVPRLGFTQKNCFEIEISHTSNDSKLGDLTELVKYPLNNICIESFSFERSCYQQDKRGHLIKTSLDRNWEYQKRYIDFVDITEKVSLCGKIVDEKGLRLIESKWEPYSIHFTKQCKIL